MWVKMCVCAVVGLVLVCIMFQICFLFKILCKKNPIHVQSIVARDRKRIVSTGFGSVAVCLYDSIAVVALPGPNEFRRNFNQNTKLDGAEVSEKWKIVASHGTGTQPNQNELNQQF